jgi:spermidine/putrescine-binding protein
MSATTVSAGIETGPAALPDATSATNRIRFFCWNRYLSPDCLTQFTRESGVAVDFVGFVSDDDCLHRVKSGEVFDVIMATDYAAHVLMGRGLLRPLDFTRLPNWEYMTVPELREPPLDPGTGGVKYTTVNYWGTEGFTARLDKVPHPVNSWKMLFDSTYKGQISMLGGAREAFAPALFLLGSDANCTDPATVEEATRMLIAQRPLVLSYDSDRVGPYLEDGTALVHCWNGDAAEAIRRGTHQFIYLLPNEGFSLWGDAPCIPANAREVEAAHLLLDFLMRPDIGALNADYSGYLPAIPAAVDLVKSLAQRSLSPTEDQVKRGVVQRDLGPFNEVYEEAFARVLAS